MPTGEKVRTISEIQKLLMEFSEKYLNDELSGYALKLLETLSKKRILSITRGGKKIWAASIIYVIARLNFLFDKENDHYLTTDTICNFFSCKKSTIGNKATQIEKACNLGIGSEGFCSQDISDALTLVQLPNGMIATKEMVKKWACPVKEIEFVQGGEDEDPSKFMDYFAEQKRRRELEKQKKKEKRAEKEKKKSCDRQLSLFDD